MANIQGSCGKQPCPVCNAPLDELSNVSKTWPPRTVAEMRQVIIEVNALSSGDQEKTLSEHGIRDVDVSIILAVL